MAQTASFQQAAQDSVADAGIFICNDLSTHEPDEAGCAQEDCGEDYSALYAGVLDAHALNLIATHGGSHFMASAFDVAHESDDTMDESDAASSSAQMHETEESSLSDNNQGGKVKRRDRSLNKLLRMQGKEYYGERKTANGYELVLRGKKEMGKPCNSIKCRMSRNTRFCYLFSEEERKVIFTDFWNMSWELRKAYVKSLTILNTPKRRSSSVEFSRKQFETQFFLPKGKKKHQVCKFTFASTLGVKSSVLQNWTRSDSEAIAKARQRAADRKNNEEPARALLKNFVSWLPEFQAQNIPPTQPFKSKRQIYSCYRDRAESLGLTPLSWPVFLTGLNESRDALLKELSAEQQKLSQQQVETPQIQALNLSSGSVASSEPSPPAAHTVRKKKTANEKKERKDRRINKLLRMQGKEYFGERKTSSGYELVLRGKKVMGKPCDSSKCKMSRNTRFCYLFTEEDREKIFNEFWRMTWEMRKEYVKTMTTVTAPKRRSKCHKQQNGPRKQLETQFYLIKNNRRHQVCKFTFLSTLGVKDWALRSWARTDLEKEETDKPKVIKLKESRIEPAKKYLKNFLILLSNIPNQTLFKSKRQVYGCYKTHAESQGMSPLSWPTFLGVFNEAQLPLIAVDSFGQVSDGSSVSETMADWTSSLSFQLSMPPILQDEKTVASLNSYLLSEKEDFLDAINITHSLGDVPPNGADMNVEQASSDEPHSSDNNSRASDNREEISEMRTGSLHKTEVSCLHCGIKFEMSWELTAHHNSINYCRTCNLTFASRAERLIHLIKEHAAFQCQCSKLCEDDETRKIHKKLCTRNYCYTCRIRLEAPDSFEQHVMSSHASLSQCCFCQLKLGGNRHKVMAHYQLHTHISPVLGLHFQ